MGKLFENILMFTFFGIAIFAVVEAAFIMGEIVRVIK